MHIINPYRFGSAGPVTLAEDTFTDTDSTALTSHTPDTDTVGGGWVNYNSGGWNIQSNALAEDGTRSGVQIGAVLETNETDVVVTADLKITEGVYPTRLFLRASDASNGWVVEIHISNGMQIREYNAGSFTTRASSTAMTISLDTFYTIQATFSGNTITATFDGGYEITYTSTFNNTATKHGIQARGRSAANTRADNFSIVSA